MWYHCVSDSLCFCWIWSVYFYTELYLYEFSYKFDIVLYQFLETGTSDITFMGRDQELKWLAFSLYPLSFFLCSPFKVNELSYCKKLFFNLFIYIHISLKPHLLDLKFLIQTTINSVRSTNPNLKHERLHHQVATI